MHFARVDHWLDNEPANRALADERLARIVVNSLFHFAGVRYEPIAFVVMPSHIHWLFQPTSEWIATLPAHIPTLRERIRYSMRRDTATQLNLIVGWFVRSIAWRTSAW